MTNIDKETIEKDKIKEMLSEAEKTAIDIIESKYPKVIAAEFVVNLPVGLALPNDSLFNGDIVKRITIRRQNRLERRKATNKMITSGGKMSNTDLAQDKMLSLIVNIQSENGLWEWGDIPQNIRTVIIDSLDIIDEDEIIEGMTALEYGFGNFKDFYASQAFRQLKEQEQQSFRGDED